MAPDEQADRQPQLQQRHLPDAGFHLPHELLGFMTNVREGTAYTPEQVRASLDDFDNAHAKAKQALTVCNSSARCAFSEAREGGSTLGESPGLIPHLAPGWGLISRPAQGVSMPTRPPLIAGACPVLMKPLSKRVRSPSKPKTRI